MESEQKGEKRAAYGEELLKQLSVDLGKCYGRGFGVDNLQRFRAFYLVYPPEQIYATLSRKLQDRKRIAMTLRPVIRTKKGKKTKRSSAGRKGAAKEPEGS